MPFNHQSIEKKWQQRWEQNFAFFPTEDPSKAQDSLYHLVMFPYPSATGLHVGHVESYSAVDIVTRWRRMQGKNVLFPIGYDAFGLPAENFAIKTGVHPEQTTNDAMANYTRQMKSLGLSFDWSRVISTADPSYYKWTQWLFLLFYKHDLIYRASAPVNWCDSCQTVLANEQVIDGKCDRCKNVVRQKDLEQWFFRITKYADRLLAGLEKIDWPESIKAMQQNWIGKSEGTEIDFDIVNVAKGRAPWPPQSRETIISVFTTRPDTLFGVSYVVLAPEHPLVDVLVDPAYAKAVMDYRAATARKSELDRSEQKEKTGQFIGAYAKHPLTGKDVPIWIADYALMTYGTGAVMGVPAHDERDYAFAQKYNLPITQVVAPPAGTAFMPSDGAYTDPGIMVQSGIFDGLTNENAKQQITDALEAKNKGRRVTNYRIRDWLLSRQRYWGAPIPIIWCEDCGPVAVPASDLPVRLPTDVDFKPTGESPLARSESFHDVKCPTCHKPARRESDTMDTFVDSSWYFLRFCDPKNEEVMADQEKIRYWMPVDLYVGGAEHAVMHLLYSRFFCYALKDLGHIDFEEPFTKLRNQGTIMGPDGVRMSKSRGNVVNPDEVVEQYGADTLRMYEMFMGPLEDQKPWDTNGAVGVRRFLEKLWKLRESVADATNPSIEKATHKAIHSITNDLEAMKFNTAISASMILVNAMSSAEVLPRSSYEMLVRALAPFAPHLCEEIWETLGYKTSVFESGWPSFEEKMLVDDLVTVAVQINGKVRGTIEISPTLSDVDARDRAQAQQNVEKFLEGKEIIKVIYIPGRLISFVIR
ncbi:leucine--tRNA ligase [Candidatus Uhrbacteria bacterium]|nr:leucine--tRNA ligase [Candidatus Uhrbacteria bacterium]